MKTLRITLATVLAILVAAPAAAQVDLSLEAHGGLGVPTGSWNDNDILGTAWGIGATAVLGVVPGTVDLYGGYDRYSFGVDDDDGELEGADASAISDGFRLGLRLYMAGSGVEPFVHAGGIYNKVNYKVSGGGAIGFDFESNRSLGVEAGGGVIIPVSRGPTTALGMVPAIRYRTHELEYDISSEFDENASAGSILFDLGVRLEFQGP